MIRGEVQDLSALLHQIHQDGGHRFESGGIRRRQRLVQAQGQRITTRLHVFKCRQSHGQKKLYSRAIGQRFKRTKLLFPDIECLEPVFPVDLQSPVAMGEPTETIAGTIQHRRGLTGLRLLPRLFEYQSCHSILECLIPRPRIELLGGVQLRDGILDIAAGTSLCEPLLYLGPCSTRDSSSSAASSYATIHSAT